jgi:hypothetical protein
MTTRKPHAQLGRGLDTIERDLLPELIELRAEFRARQQFVLAADAAAAVIALTEGVKLARRLCTLLQKVRPS